MKNHYTATAKSLHWVMAVLIIGLLALGFYMQDLPLSPEKLKLYSWHKWAGVTAFLLVLVRLAWRAGHRPPPLPASMPKPLQLAAHGGHLALYGLMLAMPLSGWLMSSAKGFQTVWFGLLPIPDLLAKDKVLGDLLQNVHATLAVLFVLILVGHVAAALKHHFIDRTDILTRMLPAPRRTDMKHALSTLALLAALSPLSAGAVEYNQVLPAKSSVAFTYQQMGVAVDGLFRKFSGQLSFDPAKPTAARVSFDVELASVDTGAPEGDAEVAGKPWFNTAAFPVARFVSSSVKALGGNRYEVAGKLTIKGRTQDVIVPATFTAQGTGGVFEGAFTLRRADFSIGEGSWAKFDIVANDVRLKFRIAASGK